MRYGTFFLLIIAICLFACGKEAKDPLKPVKIDNAADFIRNPISYKGNSADTANLPKLTFDLTSHYFGEILEGDKVRFSFKFTNTGKQDLLITEAHSTCGCTIPDWPKSAIKPGAHGEINVEFNSENKPGYQSKDVMIYANTFPNKTVVNISARVLSKE